MATLLLIELKSVTVFLESEMVGTAGFEPTTTCTPSKCATRLRYVPFPFSYAM